jgi:hypothetical protein
MRSRNQCHGESCLQFETFGSRDHHFRLNYELSVTVESICAAGTSNTGMNWRRANQTTAFACWKLANLVVPLIVVFQAMFECNNRRGRACHSASIIGMS